MIRFLYIVLILNITSCSGINLTEPLPETERQSIFGGPLKFSTETGSFSAGQKSITNLSNDSINISSIPINELLWKSTLDTLDFMVFENIDPFGGIIITKWFINENNDKIRNKITVSFSSSELRATSIKVSVIRQKFYNNQWVSDGHSDGLARKIEDLILTRARELRNKIS
tara:strand:- start:140 stop:652 length:513 start_codon:yes stop_codon:yes gene_type:complete